MRRLVLLLLASIGAHAGVCDPKALQGAYGFSLASRTTVGGTPRPVVGVGASAVRFGECQRCNIDQFHRNHLGNPVKGTYEARWDCPVEWRLRDTSGAFQHFVGSMSADGRRVMFRQTDPGGAENGILLRTTNECSVAGLKGAFRVNMTGDAVNVDTALESGPVSFSGLLVMDGAGRLAAAAGADAPPLAGGLYSVKDDCFLEVVLDLAIEGNKPRAIHFRGIVVEQGRQIVGIQTDPGTAVAFRLLSD